MTDETKAQKKKAVTQSGIMPRPVFVPQNRQETSRPTTLPELRDEGATTGVLPVVTEGEDSSAQRDEDSSTGS